MNLPGFTGVESAAAPSRLAGPYSTSPSPAPITPQSWSPWDKPGSQGDGCTYAYTEMKEECTLFTKLCEDTFICRGGTMITKGAAYPCGACFGIW